MTQTIVSGIVRRIITHIAGAIAVIIYGLADESGNRIIDENGNHIVGLGDET